MPWRRVTSGTCLLAAWLCTFKLWVHDYTTFATGRGFVHDVGVQRYAAGRDQSRLPVRAQRYVEDEWLVPNLVRRHGADIEEIRKRCRDLPPFFDDVKLLRFALDHQGNPAMAARKVRQVNSWRNGKGAAIVAAATKAVAEAQRGGGWDNTPVMAAAPFSDRISRHLTPSTQLLMSTSRGDLITCIQSASLTSSSYAIMKSVSEEQMADFYTYMWEVTTLVADERSRSSGRLVRGFVVNTLKGVSSMPDGGLLRAITESAKLASSMYPGFSGMSMLMNLPWGIDVMMGIIQSLFPASVRGEVRLSQSNVADVDDLQELLREPLKSRFLRAVEAEFYS